MTVAASVFPKLSALFRQADFDLVAGLNPAHFSGNPGSACTWFLRDGQRYTEGGGIAVQEIYFLECLVAAHRPKNIFVIGNSTGWSAIALAMMAPQASVLAMDAGFDGHSKDGLDFTNRIAAEEKLKLTAVLGVSPLDVPLVIAAQGLPAPDLIFIDGYHENEQIVKDFEICRSVAAPNCVYLFHDVHACGLRPGFGRIASQMPVAQVMMGTTSGIGIAYDPATAPEVTAVAEAFSVSTEGLAYSHAEAFRHRHPLIGKWRRSLRKRLRSLQR